MPKTRFFPTFLRVATGVVIGIIAVFVLGIALYADQTDPSVAREAAGRELRTRALEDGERIERVVPVYRRRIWDYYRATHGLLVATDRRILFIGLPPTIRASSATEGEPPLIEELAFSYDEVRASTGRVFLGRAPGIVLRTSHGRETFGVVLEGRAELDSLMMVIGDEQEERRLAAERERRARDEAARKSKAPACHRVERGEALGLIARRYNTTTEGLQALNGRDTPRIRAGETLLVRAGNEADAGGKRCELLNGEELRQWGFVVP
jgi:hypothetical protein